MLSCSALPLALSVLDPRTTALPALDSPPRPLPPLPLPLRALPLPPCPLPLPPRPLPPPAAPGLRGLGRGLGVPVGSVLGVPLLLLNLRYTNLRGHENLSRTTSPTST